MPQDVTYAQSGRWITLDSPLGTDALIPVFFRGEESLSRPFAFTIEAVSNQTAIDPGSLLGKSVSLTLNRAAGDPRIFNGLVTSFAAGPMARSGYRRYTLYLSPWLTLLDRTSDCRIYQNKSVKDIATSLFSDAGFTDYQFKLQGTYNPREFCVQYEETDFAFMSRLFEEEGIFYYFTHASGTHTMVIADQTAAYAACADSSAVYRAGGQPQAEALHEWEPGWRYRSGVWTLRDYNFTSPSVDLTSTTNTILSPSAFASWERFEYPGWYDAKADGDTRVKLRMEAEEAAYAVVSGAGTYAAYSPGRTFSLSEHPVSSEVGQTYALVTVAHEAADHTLFPLNPGPVERPYYRNSFTCMPGATLFVPPRVTPRPVMRGPQTAVVTGASGDEICTDSYGRVKVQFPWDRLGTNDDTSSCFIRVAQMLAGSGWGSLFTPRVGMEVVVDFLDGNPDRPLITGCVYNANNAAPYTLPDNKTQSGILTRSTTGGDATTANEIFFDDNKGSELFRLHAEKDFLREVENDDTLTVGNNQTLTVTQNRALTVSNGDDSVTVSAGNQSITVSKGNQTIDVAQGNQSVTVDQGNRTVSIAQGDDTLTVGNKLSTTVKQGDMTTTVSTGNHSLTVSTGNDSTTVSTGNHSVTVSTGNSSTTASVGSISLSGTGGVKLACGSNTIELSQSGVTINGMSITIKGSIEVQIQGAMSTLKGDGTVTIKGGVVMIN